MDDIEKQRNEASSTSSVGNKVMATHGPEHDHAAVKRAWRKVDLHIMPVAALLYLASYIDRSLSLTVGAIISYHITDSELLELILGMLEFSGCKRNLVYHRINTIG